MLNSPRRSIMWSGILALMLLSLLSPFSILTVSFMMVPILFLFVTLEQRSFMIHVGITLGLILLLTGGVGLIMVLIGLFFVIPAVVMGWMYKRNVAAHAAILATILTLVIELLLVILIANMFGFDLMTELELILRDTYHLIQDIMPGQISEEMIQQQVFAITQMIPSYIIIFAVYYTLVTHWIGRKLLIRAGKDVAGLPPVRTWKLPASVVWIYIGVLVLSFFVRQDESSMFTMIFYNVLPLLTIAFCVQGVSFLFFLSYVKRWNKMLPAVGIVACMFASTLMSILGVIDIMFDLRQKLQGNNSKR